ncbi:hypothetical protein SBRCBS47491_001777 [Sporothrix bragantina]|uniref:Uncharacterized protein n=1 Tax=Sporothrix bragantina TaxID=671064 RepID=A0ABP0B1C5_9PEZI
MEPCGKEEKDHFLDWKPGTCKCCVLGLDLTREPSHVTAGEVDLGSLVLTHDLCNDALQANPGLNLEGVFNRDRDFQGIDDMCTNLDTVVEWQEKTNKAKAGDDCSCPSRNSGEAAAIHDIQAEAAAATMDAHGVDDTPSHSIPGLEEETENMGMGDLMTSVDLDDDSVNDYLDSHSLLGSSLPFQAPQTPSSAASSSRGPCIARRDPTSFATVDEFKAYIETVLQDRPK